MGKEGRRWAVNFYDRTPSSDATAFPPGLSRTHKDVLAPSWQIDAEANLKLEKAWEVARSPLKNVIMMGFVVWMAGKTVHLFSIAIILSALLHPINALWRVAKIFEPFKDNKVELFEPMLVFIALNLGGLALGIWKLNSLGILPTHASDWVSSLAPPQEVEQSYGGIFCH